MCPGGTPVPSDVETATVTVALNPHGVGVNPVTNRIYVANQNLGNGCGSSTVSVIDGSTNTVAATVTVGGGPIGVGVNPTTGQVYVSNNGPPNAPDGSSTVSVLGRREEIREACLAAVGGNCLVVSSTGTLFPSTPQSTAVNLVAVSLRSNVTNKGVQAALTVICDNNTTNATLKCSALYIDGNVWGPARDNPANGSSFIIVNAQSYFYLQWHWWDPVNQRILAWAYWWHGTHVSPNWYWSVYWYWRTYTNWNVGTWLPWWWWWWHWTYLEYWNFWTVNIPA